MGNDMSQKCAVITGITGQDGAYLAQLLLSKGYRVVGVVRRSSHFGVATHRLDWLKIANQVELVDGDLLDLGGLCRIIRESKPSEIYNLAAQSFVKTSWAQPALTAQANRRRGCQRPRGHASRSARSALLSGLLIRDVWPDPRRHAERDDPILPAVTICRRQVDGALDDHQLP